MLYFGSSIVQNELTFIVLFFFFFFNYAPLFFYNQSLLEDNISYNYALTLYESNRTVFRNLIKAIASLIL